MKTNRICTHVLPILAWLGLVLTSWSTHAHNAHISGVTGTTFNLTASPAYISAGNGGSILM